MGEERLRSWDRGGLEGMEVPVDGQQHRDSLVEPAPLPPEAVLRPRPWCCQRNRTTKMVTHQIP